MDTIHLTKMQNFSLRKHYKKNPQTRKASISYVTDKFLYY